MTDLDLVQGRLLVNYTDRDFIALVVALRSRISVRFPQITDFNTARTIQMIIELFSAVGDRLFFMQDRHAGETNLVTARQRQNILNLALTIGYQGASATAATGTIQIDIDGDAVTGDVVLEKGGVTIQTKEPDNPQTFQLYETVSIPGGSTQVTALIKNSLTFNQDTTGTGQANQEIILTETPFLNDGSIKVYVNSELWTQVDNFVSTSATDKHFIIRLNADDKAKIRFGDGVNGVIPLDGQDIEITYETGGGAAGNQAAGTITENTNDFASNLSEPVSLTFTNPAATTGGADRETTDEIRFKAPRALSTNKRTVTRRDFSVNVEDNVSGVGRALAFSNDQDPLIPENTAHVYVAPPDGSTASSSVLTDVEDCLTNEDRRPTMLTMDIAAFSAIYLPIVLTGTVYIDKNVDFSTAKALVQSKLADYFSLTNIDQTTLEYTIKWGDQEPELEWSPIVDIIQSTRGVKYMRDFSINGLAANEPVPVSAKELPLLDTSNFDVSGGLEFVQLS